jgi:hypothetical protein
MPFQVRRTIQPELLCLNRSGPAENDVCNATGGLSRFGADGIMREREHEAARAGLGQQRRSFSMCDYSLQNVKSRPAKVGEKLRTQHFNTGTIGFAAPEDTNMAVCVLPGTELAFANSVRCSARGGLFSWRPKVVKHTTAIFRQVNNDNPRTHHDALEFPDGRMVLLTHLFLGQEATVLQLPAQPVTPAEIKAQERVRHVG